MALDLKQRDEIDRLAVEGAGGRTIAQQVGVPYGTVRRYLEDTQAGARPFRAVVYDLETTNLRSDIGALIVGAFYDLATGHVSVRSILDFDGTRRQREKQLAEWCAAQYEAAHTLISFNGLAFDKNFQNGVLGRHGLPNLPKRHHIDLYQVARNGWKGIPQSYSLANLLDVFNVEMAKDKPSKHDWREANLLDDEAIDRIVTRCVRDVQGTALLWEKLEPYWQDWRGR